MRGARSDQSTPRRDKLFLCCFGEGFCLCACVFELLLCVSPRAFWCVYGFGFNKQDASLTPPCRRCDEVIV